MKTVTVTIEHDVSAGALGEYILQLLNKGIAAVVIKDERK